MARRKLQADATAAPGLLVANGTGRFTLSGELGFRDAARLLGEGEAAFGALEAAEIDLAGVSRVDSAGLAVLLEWSLAARAAGHSLSYRNIPPAIASLAGISDVEELLAPAAGG